MNTRNSALISTIATLMAASSALAAPAPVSKISYQCQGNTRTFIGPNEVGGMDAGKKFKFDVAGATDGFNLSVGPTSAHPDFQLIPVSRNQVEILVADNNPVSLTTDGPVSFQLGDTLVQSQHATKISTTPDGTSVSMADSGVTLSKKDFHAVLDVTSKDGNFTFQSADGKILNCSISIN
jgi:hypothetical protein